MQDKTHGLLFTFGFIFAAGGFFSTGIIGFLGVPIIILGIIMVIAGEIRNKMFKTKTHVNKLAEVNKVLELKTQREIILSELKEEIIPSKIKKEKQDTVKLGEESSKAQKTSRDTLELMKQFREEHQRKNNRKIDSQELRKWAISKLEQLSEMKHGDSETITKFKERLEKNKKIDYDEVDFLEDCFVTIQKSVATEIDNKSKILDSLRETIQSERVQEQKEDSANTIKTNESDDPVEILKIRMAKGEITVEEIDKIPKSFFYSDGLPNSPSEILKKRYAIGEITLDEFNKIKENLEKF